MRHLVALVAGCALDALLGDPYRMPHIIRLVGALIAQTERLLRGVFPATPRGECWAGRALVVVVVGVSVGGCVLALWVADRCSPWLGLVVETVVCYQMLAARQLEIEALRVRDALAKGDLPAARAAVSMIVGRDTAMLDEAGVARAAVETVAENASDGVVAPLLFMAVGGAPAGMLYKAVNTMDSMVGYKNKRYRHFGTAAARLDDALNWIPARVTALLMCLAAPLVGLDGAGAWRICRRDRHNHPSPNSAHPEAACAGALGVQLAGPTSYFGVMHDKPTIGDYSRPVCADDITRSCRLLRATALLALALGLLPALAVDDVAAGYWDIGALRVADPVRAFATCAFVRDYSGNSEYPVPCGDIVQAGDPMAARRGASGGVNHALPGKNDIRGSLEPNEASCEERASD